MILKYMKNYLTTGTWQDDISCPINIILFCTSDEVYCSMHKEAHWQRSAAMNCPSTYQQQIRHFNSLMVDVSVPTTNTLHGMPSLSHLSSTQSELGNCNVHYSGFDTDLSTPASLLMIK